jgi:hypothetical protein
MTDTTIPLIAGYFDYFIHLGVSFSKRVLDFLYDELYF